MSKTESAPPYALFEGSAGGFLTVEFDKGKVALPYLALRQITHQESPERLVLEFTDQNIEVQGKGLGMLFEALALVRVKAIRQGREDKGGCQIEKIVPLEG